MSLCAYAPDEIPDGGDTGELFIRKINPITLYLGNNRQYIFNYGLLINVVKNAIMLTLKNELALKTHKYLSTRARISIQIEILSKNKKTDGRTLWA